MVRPRRAALLGGGAALAVWCGWVSGFHRSTTAAEVTWVVSLAFVVAVAVAFWLGRRGSRVGWPLRVAADPWPRPGRGGGRRALLGVAPWLAVIAVAAVWDVLGIDTGTHEAHLTISALSQFYRPLNALLLLVWMLVGIGYAAARARAPTIRADAAVGGGGLTSDRTERGAAFGRARRARGRPLGHPGAVAAVEPSRRRRLLARFLVVAVAVDVVARRSAGRLATAEEFARFISTAWPANVALIAAWAFAGYHLFAR